VPDTAAAWAIRAADGAPIPLVPNQFAEVIHGEAIPPQGLNPAISGALFFLKRAPFTHAPGGAGTAVGVGAAGIFGAGLRLTTLRTATF